MPQRPFTIDLELYKKSKENLSPRLCPISDLNSVQGPEQKGAGPFDGVSLHDDNITEEIQMVLVT